MVCLAASISSFLSWPCLQSVSFSHTIFLAIFCSTWPFIYLDYPSLVSLVLNCLPGSHHLELFGQSAKCCKLNGNNNGLGPGLGCSGSGSVSGSGSETGIEAGCGSGFGSGAVASALTTTGLGLHCAHPAEPLIWSENRTDARHSLCALSS